MNTAHAAKHEKPSKYAENPLFCRHFNSALGGNQNAFLRFRKPLLYPLSYEGGDGAKCGALFADTPCVISIEVTGERSGWKECAEIAVILVKLARYWFLAMQKPQHQRLGAWFGVSVGVGPIRRSNALQFGLAMPQSIENFLRVSHQPRVGGPLICARKTTTLLLPA